MSVRTKSLYRIILRYTTLFLLALEPQACALGISKPNNRPNLTNNALQGLETLVNKNRHSQSVVQARQLKDKSSKCFDGVKVSMD